MTWFIELQNKFNELKLFKISMIYVLNWVDDLTSWQLSSFMQMKQLKLWDNEISLHETA